MLQHGIGHVTEYPSLMCVGAFPDAAFIRHHFGRSSIVSRIILDQSRVRISRWIFAPGFTCRPSDLIALFGVLSAYKGFSVSFVHHG